MREKTSSGLSVAQVIAGALASASAAVLASTFGVAGTIIGAAMTSATIAIASVLYRRSIEGARDRVRTRYQRSNGAPRSQAGRQIGPRRRLAWGAIAGGTVLIFAVSMGGLTAFETMARASAAQLMGTDSGNARTTVGAVVQTISSDGSGEESPAPSPSESPSPEESMPPVAPAGADPSPTPTVPVEPARNAGKPKASDPPPKPSQSPPADETVPTESADPTAAPGTKSPLPVE